MASHRWARVLESGAHGLRRGAWYPIVNDSRPEIVILDVNKNNVPVDRASLELADAKPGKWSVVKWNPAGVPRRISQAKLPMTYGVCPHCRARAEIPERETKLDCPECKKTSEVDWVNTC
jgi:hypothetical protein